MKSIHLQVSFLFLIYSRRIISILASEETGNDRNEATQAPKSQRKSSEGRRFALVKHDKMEETGLISTKLPSNLSLDPRDEFGSLAEPTSFEQAYNLKSLHKEQSRKLEFMNDEKFVEELKIDEKEEELAEFQPKAFRHEPNWYHDKCRELAEQGKIAECCAMLEQRMLQEDHVRPTKRNFSVVLQALGEKGFTKKAFEIYGKMKQYGLDPIPSHFTSLFNACANSPYPEAALERANRLRTDMKHKLFNIPRPLYHAMIKAFARLKDLETAFTIVDEMRADGLTPDTETYCHLLQACIAEKEAGFTLAVEVWRQMLKRGHRPSIFAYNLLLRACRDCSVGDVKFAEDRLFLKRKQHPKLDSALSAGALHAAINDLMQKSVPSLLPSLEDPVWSEISSSFQQMLPIPNGDNGASSLEPDEILQIPTQLETENSNQPKEFVPLTDRITEAVEEGVRFKNHILNPKFRKPDGVTGLGDLSTPQARFELIGGILGVLKLMERHEILPDVKTFSEMLDVIPNAQAAEMALIEHADRLNIRLDTDFFNLLIKRRAFRNEYESARSLLPLLLKRGLRPNQMTFGCLALGCKRSEAAALLHQMESLGISANLIILTPMIKNSIMKYDFWYAIDILNYMKKHGIPPQERFLSNIERRMENVQKFMAKIDRKPKEFNDYFRSDYVRNGYKIFRKFYPTWLKQIGVDHPAPAWAELDKKIDPDDLKEDWEKPWLKEKAKI